MRRLLNGRRLFQCGYPKVRHLGAYISGITLQRLPLFSNSEVNISAAPWSSFYAFIDILSINQAWPATLLKRRFRQRCFPVNFVKFLITPFIQNTSGRLLLHVENNLLYFTLSFFYKCSLHLLE